MEWDPCETRNYYRETRFVNQVKLQQKCLKGNQVKPEAGESNVKNLQNQHRGIWILSQTRENKHSSKCFKINSEKK